MTKSKLLSIAVIALIGLNLAMLGFHFMKKEGHPNGMPPHHKRGGPKNYIIKELQFNDAQIEAYEVLIDFNKADIGDKQIELQEEKQRMYALLAAEDKVQQKELLKRIGRLHAVIDSIHFEHFKSIKALCREDQLDSFDRLSKELARLFSPPKPPKRH